MSDAERRQCLQLRDVIRQFSNLIIAQIKLLDNSQRREKPVRNVRKFVAADPNAYEALRCNVQRRKHDASWDVFCIFP